MPFDDAEVPVRAAELCVEGHFAEASDLLRPFAEREPHNPSAWSLLARAELGAERYGLALQAAEHARELAPEEALPEVVLAVSLFGLGRTKEGLERARAAVALDPEDFAAVSLLARILSATGCHGDARALAEQAIELEPAEPQAYLVAGMVAAAAGRRDEARGSFREVLALDPGNGAAQHELARLRLRRRVNDPAALAAAAAGFARAAATDTQERRSQQSLERVLRKFLEKTAYLLFLDAYLVIRVTSSSNDAAARWIPVALLGIPAYYAIRFVRHLTPEPRRRLLWMLIGERAVSVAAALESVAVVAILIGAGGASLRQTAGIIAGLAALAARASLGLAVDRAARESQGRPSQYAVRAGLIWVIAGVLGLLAVALLIAAVMRGRPSAAIGALVCLAAGAALARVALGRRVSR